MAVKYQLEGRHRWWYVDGIEIGITLGPEENLVIVKRKSNWWDDVSLATRNQIHGLIRAIFEAKQIWG